MSLTISPRFPARKRNVPSRRFGNKMQATKKDNRQNELQTYFINVFFSKGGGWLPVGICQALFPSNFSHPKFTNEAIKVPKLIHNCNVVPNAPLKSAGI